MRVLKIKDLRITPYRSFPVFKLASPDAPHNKGLAHTVFLRGRHIAKGCPFAIPFTVFRHNSSL